MTAPTTTLTTPPAVTGPPTTVGSGRHRRPSADPLWISLRYRAGWLWRSRSRNRLLLAGVALMFGLAQLRIMGLHYGYGWDEAVYLSMANPVVPDAAWSPWRAWGTSLLAAPVAYVNAPAEIIRLYLMILSSVSLYLAFRTWLVLRDVISVPLAAFLFSSVFVTIYYGPYAMPNYYVAVGSVAATGFFLRSCRRSGRRPWRNWLGLAGSVGLVALVRPSDSVWLVAALGLGWLALRPWLVLRAWRAIGVLVAIVGGEILGWAPWFVEAYTRFGGPLHRWQLSRSAVGGGLHLDLRTVELYVRMSGGSSLMCYCVNRPQLAGHLNVAALVWWATAGLLVLTGVVVHWRGARRAEAALPFLVGLSLAIPYLWVLEYAAARFLLPAFALMSLPAAQALIWATRSIRSARPRWRPAVVAALVGLLLANVGLQLNVLRIRMPGDARLHAVAATLNPRIRAAGISPPCLLVGAPSPMLLNYLPCEWNVDGRSSYLRVEPPAVRWARETGAPVGIITTAALPPDSYLRGWRMVSLDLPAQPGWRLYLPPL